MQDYPPRAGEPTRLSGKTRFGSMNYADRRVYNARPGLRTWGGSCSLDPPFAEYRTATAMALIECVPNISEGRQPEVLDDLAAAVRTTQGVQLLDHSADPAHNRSVLTFVGDPDAVHAAVLALFEVAVRSIDLRTHRGEHPRIGAVDVVPFVPLHHTEMAACIELAQRTAVEVASRLGVPVYLYEEAATHPRRRNLEDIRRGQFEGLSEKMRHPEWRPDFGPAMPHPTAGASVIGARPFLIAYNVNLATDRLDIARAVAAAVRQSSGGLPFVKALGLVLDDRGIVQVSMNLTDFARTSIVQAFDAVASEAARHGVAVRESEIIGLVPAAALTQAAAEHVRLRPIDRGQILEEKLRAAKG